MAAGGALGGVFNALLAPLLFDSFLEYPLAIVAACLLRPTRTPRGSPLARSLDFTLPAMLGFLVTVLLVALPSGNPETTAAVATIVLGFAAGLLVNFARRPVRLGLGLAAFMIAGTLALDVGDVTLERERSFFGTHHVVRRGETGGPGPRTACSTGPRCTASSRSTPGAHRAARLLPPDRPVRHPGRGASATAA